MMFHFIEEKKKMAPEQTGAIVACEMKADGLFRALQASAEAAWWADA